MARKVLVRLVDDLDGLPSDDVATVTFSLDRVSYQIDLNEANANKLRDGLAEFIAAARRTGGRVRRGAGGPAHDGPAIREWAREQGHELAERGRIPAHVIDAYNAAKRGSRSRGRAKAAAAATPSAGTVTKSAAKAPAKSKSATKTAKAAPKATAKASPAAKATPTARATVSRKPAAKAPARKARS
jgi:Lsr2